MNQIQFFWLKVVSKIYELSAIDNEYVRFEAPDQRVRGFTYRSLRFFYKIGMVDCNIQPIEIIEFYDPNNLIS